MFSLLRHRVPVMTMPGMVADALLGFAAVLLAAWSLPSLPALSNSTLHGWSESSQLILFAADFALVMSLTYALAGLYRPTPVALATALRRTAVALSIGGMVAYWTLRYLAEPQFAEELVQSALVYLGAGLVIARGGWYVFARSATLPRVLIVGAGAEAAAVARDLSESKRIERRVAGFYAICDSSLDRDALGNVPVYRKDQRLPELVAKLGIDEIIVTVKEQRGGAVPLADLLSCRIKGVPVLDLAAFYERTRSEVPLETLKASWLIYGKGFVQSPMRAAVKRTFDLLTSSILLILASPVMLLTMLAIRLDSPGPVIYKQERVGRGGRTFMCLKFRSMRTDAEKDGVARWAVKNDTRITRIGAFIRKTRIDELPQLFSVLRGEMSMVGPRPERPSFVAQLREQIPFYDVRHSIKPGVTGWAQVRYSYGATLDDARRKHQFDLYYVKNNSLWLDFLVLIETVSVVLFREGQ